MRGFNLDLREHLDDGLNDGVYSASQGGDATKVALALSPGKAYVRGFEIETAGQTYVPLYKARTTAFTQNYPTMFSAGNFLQVENTYNTPDIDSTTSIVPFKEVQLRNKRQPVAHLTATLAAATNSTTTSGIGAKMAVDNVSLFPQSGGFIVNIGNELINIASVDLANNRLVIGNVANLSANGRAYGGSSGGSADEHLANAPV